ncbi:TrbC/VirB2 family protein [Candidatus Cyrtobacter comes]|nr:TrbC/VirB2 family protein [Candidatus Cyrtobacter comes]
MPSNRISVDDYIQLMTFFISTIVIMFFISHPAFAADMDLKNDGVSKTLCYAKKYLTSGPVRIIISIIIIFIAFLAFVGKVTITTFLTCSAGTASAFSSDTIIGYFIDGGKATFNLCDTITA